MLLFGHFGGNLECTFFRKKTAAERLKREMEYIGVSLNNIIPSASVSKQDPYQTLSESTESEDDGQRKSKKKAMK